jgi:hypothetical protein
MVALNGIFKTTLGEIEKLGEKQEHRPYLGMSQIGHSCSRYLWYSFRWAYEINHSARLLRLFNRGHREEPAIVETLNKIGIICYGDQTEIVMAHGHAKGHCDGMSMGVIEAPKTVHLNEYKTMSDKYFKEVCKLGVKASKPIYYAQCQIYMKKLKLTRTLFIAVNKNDDSMYIERIKYSKDFADELERKAEDIILSEKPPKKEFDSTWFECKYCDARDICHFEGIPEKNCRTCENCDILPEGKWECSRHNIPLATGQQRIGCNKYQLLDCLKV